MILDTFIRLYIYLDIFSISLKKTKSLPPQKRNKLTLQ